MTRRAMVLVPILFKINPGTVLLFNGIGTLLYLSICKGKIPVYLGSSFAFISPVLLLPRGYELALGGIAYGALFCLVGLIVKKAGTGWINVISPCRDGGDSGDHRPGAGQCRGQYGWSAAYSADTPVDATTVVISMATAPLVRAADVLPSAL